MLKVPILPVPQQRFLLILKIIPADHATLEELAKITATLPAEGRKEGDVVAVRLEASVSDLGVLELRAVSRKDERWKVELSTR